MYAGALIEQRAGKHAHTSTRNLRETEAQNQRKIFQKKGYTSCPQALSQYKATVVLAHVVVDQARCCAGLCLCSQEYVDVVALATNGRTAALQGLAICFLGAQVVSLSMQTHVPVYTQYQLYNKHNPQVAADVSSSPLITGLDAPVDNDDPKHKQDDAETYKTMLVDMQLEQAKLSREFQVQYALHSDNCSPVCAYIQSMLQTCMANLRLVSADDKHTNMST